VDWMYLAQDSDQWRTVVNTVMNLPDISPPKADLQPSGLESSLRHLELSCCCVGCILFAITAANPRPHYRDNDAIHSVPPSVFELR